MESADLGKKARSEGEIEAALEAVKNWIIKEPLAIGPDGFPKAIHLITIKDALEELLEKRSRDGEDE